jgi:hypothetical protein
MSIISYSRKLQHFWAQSGFVFSISDSFGKPRVGLFLRRKLRASLSAHHARSGFVFAISRCPPVDGILVARGRHPMVSQSRPIGPWHHFASGNFRLGIHSISKCVGFSGVIWLCFVISHRVVRFAPSTARCFVAPATLQHFPIQAAMEGGRR